MINKFSSQLYTTNLRALLLMAFIGAGVMLHTVFAVNVPVKVSGVGGDDLQSDKATQEATSYAYDDYVDGEDQNLRLGAGVTRRYDQSVYWSARLGAVNNTRGENVDFKGLFQVGAIEGVRSAREIKDFDLVFSRLYADDAVARRPLAMQLHLDKLTADTFDPASLYIENKGTYKRIEDQGFINQVITESAITHVDKLSDGFRIRVWGLEGVTLSKQAGNTLYDIPTTNPILDTLFKKPENYTGTDELLVIEKKDFGTSGANALTYHYVQDPATDTLTISTYAGETTSGDLLRREDLQYSARGLKRWDYTVEREEYLANLSSEGIIGNLTKIAHTQEIYEDHSRDGKSGESGKHRLISYKKNYNTPEEETTLTAYYKETGNPWVDGLIKSETHPEGSTPKPYIQYDYLAGSEAAVFVVSKKESATPITGEQGEQIRLTEWIISANEVVKTVIDAGVVTSKVKTTKSQDQEDTVLTTFIWQDNAWLTDKVESYHLDSAESHLAGRRKWTENTDLTAEIYQYELLENGHLKITQHKGAGNRSSITSGEQTESTYDKNYNLESLIKTTIASGDLVQSKVADLTEGVDNAHRSVRWTHINPTEGAYTRIRYGSTGLETTLDLASKTIVYYRDALGRVYKKTEQNSEGLEITTFYDHVGLQVTESVPDSDGDGLPDEWEQTIVDFDPNDSIATIADVLFSGDYDGDGAFNIDEFQQGTNPFIRDSDGDGYSDALSINLELNLKLDEENGGVAVDSGPIEHLGFLVDNPSWQPVGGVNNGALQFLGGADAVTLPATALHSHNDLSVSLWFKTNSQAAKQALLSSANATHPSEFSILLEQTSQPSDTIRIDAGSGEAFTFVRERSLSDNLWHHVVIVRDLVNSSVTLYLDGEAEGTNSSANSLLALNVEALTLGQSHTGVSSYDATAAFVGNIDEVRLYSAVLESNHILELFQPNDLDTDGLPDDYEESITGNLSALIHAGADLDGDGINNREEFERGSDPLDYYNSLAPVISLVSGGGQTIYNGQQTPTALLFKVTSDGSTPLMNAPVKLEHLGLLGSVKTLDGKTLSSSITLTTDSNGEVSVYFKAD